MLAFAKTPRADEIRLHLSMTAAADITAVALNRDQTAYAALFRNFAPKLKSYLRHSGVSNEMAEEITQEALFRVWRSAHYFDVERGTAASWIYRIARNLWRDRLRNEKRARDPNSFDGEELCDRDAEQIFFDRQDSRNIEKALWMLAPKLSEAIRLSYFEHLTHAQIAIRLNVPLGTVKSRLRLAVSKLRQHLDDAVEPMCTTKGEPQVAAR
jgi:RNA polymerase sigma-70 factor (ECF subfamily)